MFTKTKGGKTTVRLDAAERRLLVAALELAEGLRLHDKAQDSTKAATYLNELVRRTDMETGAFSTGDDKSPAQPATTGRA